MKRNISLHIAVACFFAMGSCFGETLFELLCSFREEMVHYPGVGIVRSVERTLSDGGGSSGELTLAFKHFAEKLGIESEVVTGTVAMTSLQLSEWLPDIGSGIELGATVASDGRWLVPMTWLRCRTGYLHGLQGYGSEGKEWIDVFPGLVGSSALFGEWQQVNETSVRELVSNVPMLLELTEPEGVVEAGEWCCWVGEELVEVLESQARTGVSKEHLGRRGAVSGYKSKFVQSVRPVDVRSRSELEAVAEPILEIVLTGRAGGYGSVEVPLWSLPEGVLELNWVDSERGGSLLDSCRVGELVFGKRGVPVFNFGECHVEGGGDFVGSEVVVSFRLFSGGELVEEVEDAVRVGDRSVYVISQSGYDFKSGKDMTTDDDLILLARELCRRQGRFRQLSELRFGESSHERLLVSKVSRRMCGTMRDGVLYRLSGYELLVGRCGWPCGSRNLALSQLLGQGLVAAELLLELGFEGLESGLGIWRDVIVEGEGEFIVGRLSAEGERQGTMSGDGRAYVHWDGISGLYEGYWCAEDGSWQGAGIVKVPWDDGGTLGFGSKHGDESWMTVVSLLADMAASGLWRYDVHAGEIGHLAVFSAVYEMLKCQPIFGDVAVERCVDSTTGEAYVKIDLNCRSTSWWTLSIVDSFGKCVFMSEGEGDGAVLNWDGRTPSGVVCDDGEYVVQVTLGNGEAVRQGIREVTLDFSCPQVELLAYSSMSEGSQVLSVEYGIFDYSEVSGTIQVVDSVSGETLLQDVLPETSGEWTCDVGASWGRTCQVTITGVDAYGNYGSASSLVVLGNVYVGGEVWTPDGGGVSEQPDTLSLSIEHPSEGATISEGILAVSGKIEIADGSVCEYQLRLRDGTGKLLSCQEIGGDGEWLLSYSSAISSPESELELLHPVRRTPSMSGLLGRLDMSGLKNGSYRLELVGMEGDGVAVCSVDFQLCSDLKMGFLEYSEKDAELNVGGLRLSLIRTYSSLAGDGELGHGWTVNLDNFDISLNEDRAEAESITGGRVSVRNGGGRDVTLTLPDGRRVTFVFSLVPGGGWSYSYYGTWTAPTGCSWTLRSTVNSDVTALPGLEPYWKAGGMGIPLDMYDFPGFVLTSPDGRCYTFEREKLGDYEAVGEDGGSIMTSCYGALKLSSVNMNGEGTLQVGERMIQWIDGSGVKHDMIAVKRDGQGRVSKYELLDGSGVSLEYGYSETGNLVSVSRRIGSEEAPQLIRRYYYDHDDFPHFLTKVENGSGLVLTQYEYDERGGLVGCVTGQGGSVGVSRDVFSRTEIRTDERGNDTVYRFDVQGNVTEICHPDGGIVSYGYNEDGKLVRRVDGLGRETFWNYDEHGRLASRSDAVGDVTSYGYDSQGRWKTVEDALGRRITRSLSLDGRRSSVQFANGSRLETSTDSAGRLVHADLHGVMSGSLDYRYEGDHCVVISDGAGEELEVVRETDSGRSRTTYSWLEESSGKVMSLASETTVDSAGRTLYHADSFGNTVDITRDIEGRVLEEVYHDGSWHRKRYDAFGHCVEEKDSTGRLVRRIYASSGQVEVEAGPETFSGSSSDGTYVFSVASFHEYDSRGRLSAVYQRTHVTIGLRELGGGFAECVLIDGGDELSCETLEYDVQGQVVKRELADGTVLRFGYDLAGRMSWQEDGAGNRTSYTYGRNGLLLNMTGGAGERTTWNYDSVGACIGRTDADGRKHSYGRTSNGKLVRVESDGCDVLELLRDTNGRLLGASQGGLQVVYERDSVGRLMRAGVGDKWLVTYTRDSFGRILSQTTAGGRVSAWRYESCLADFNTYFDGAGNRQEVERDSRGRMISLTGSRSSGEQLTVLFQGDDKTVLKSGDMVYRSESWERDGCGYPVAFSVDGRVEKRYGYDVCNRICSYESSLTAFQQEFGANGAVSCRRYSRYGGNDVASDLEVRIDYDGSGRPVVERWSGGRRETRYDLMGRVRCVDYYRGDVHVYGSEYGFDSGGRRVSQSAWKLVDGQRMSWTIQWDYDVAGRLVGENRTGHGAFRWECRYDVFGNMVWERRERGDVVETFEHGYDADHCMVSSNVTGSLGEYCVTYEWDGAGRLVSERCSGVVSWGRTYSWDVFGRLSEVSMVEEDGHSRTHVAFEYDCSGLLCGYVRAEETSEGRVEVEYRFSHERLIHEAIPQIVDFTKAVDGSLVEQCSVLRGSVPLGYVFGEHAVDLCCDGHSGTLFGERLDGELDAWGYAYGEEQADGFGAFGEWVEGSTGLVYLRGRFYSPRLRRFISRDRIMGDEENPHTFHAYSYCLNDPLNRRDPTGAFSVLALQLSMGVGLGLSSYYIPSLFITSYWDYVLMNEVSAEAIRRSKERSNSTVFVHGMAFHDKGWARPMIDALEKEMHLGDQDYYEFRWSGFSVFPLHLGVPKAIVHMTAMVSLSNYLLEVVTKGYEHVNVISHSWGTVLSRDVLELLQVGVGAWVTMGSPLSVFYPTFPKKHWLNVWNSVDPVVWMTPLLFVGGYTATSIPLANQLHGVRQLRLYDTSSLHSCYWYNGSVLKTLQEILISQ